MPRPTRGNQSNYPDSDGKRRTGTGREITYYKTDRDDQICLRLSTADIERIDKIKVANKLRSRADVVMPAINSYWQQAR